MILKKVIRVTSNLVTAGGVLLAGRSLTNPNPALHKELGEKSAILFEARERYGVGFECHTLGALATVCNDFVRGYRTNEEKEAILAQYHQEVELRQSNVPVDPEAHRQAVRDGLGVLIGMTATAIGLLGREVTAETEQRKGRQFRNRIESRQSGRKEKM